MTREFGEKCGICGIYGHPEAANLTYLGLHALQHRGQQACDQRRVKGQDRQAL